MSLSHPRREVSRRKRVKLLPSLLLGIFALAAFLHAQVAPRMPSWLSPYPGTSEQTRALGPVVESNYTATAAPREVLAHYRQLFQAAGQRLEPTPGGAGFMIRGATEDCDLFIRIRRTDSGSTVQTTCSVGPDPPGHTQRMLDQAEADSRRREQSMSKYDKPVYPTPQKALAVPVWPAWLMRTDGAALTPTKGADQFGYRYLHASFIGGDSRNDIQAFYAALLKANGYEVYMQSLAAVPANSKGLVEARRYADGDSGPRMVIRIELTPVEQGISVDLRMTSRR